MRAHITLAQDWTQGGVPVDAALRHGDAGARIALARQLAGRPGPIVGMTALDEGDHDIPLAGLVRERSLSIDTAAVGGNASVATIG